MFSIIESYKALVITILLSSTVVLLAFNVHLKKKSGFETETYYELLPEDETLKEKEELAELMKSIDELMSTNKAYNETEENDDFEDEAFQNTMEKIRNRATNDADLADEVKDYSSSKAANDEEATAYENINELIANRSEKKRTAIPSNTSGNNKKSSVSYSLVNRTDEFLPPPIYLCEQSGKIVISIKVDNDGNVIEANFNSSSTSSNGCLVDHAIEYAKASKFNADPSKQEQLGTITFYFRGKS